MPVFGLVHLSLLAATLAIAVAVAALCRSGRIGDRPVRLALGYGLAVNEIVWWIFRYSHEGVHLSNLPLQLCDATVWLSVAACLTIRPFVTEVAYFAGVAGAGMALITPDLWSPWPSYPAVYFFLAHGGIVIACAVLIFGGICRVRPGAWLRASGALLLYAFGVGMFDWISGANYMYLRGKPKSGSLLDAFGSWPVYFLPSLALAMALFWLLELLATRTPLSAAPRSVPASRARRESQPTRS